MYVDVQMSQFQLVLLVLVIQQTYIDNSLLMAEQNEMTVCNFTHK